MDGWYEDYLKWANGESDAVSSPSPEHAYGNAPGAGSGGTGAGVQFGAGLPVPESAQATDPALRAKEVPHTPEPFAPSTFANGIFNNLFWQEPPSTMGDAAVEVWGGASEVPSDFVVPPVLNATPVTYGPPPPTSADRKSEEAGGVDAFNTPEPSLFFFDPNYPSTLTEEQAKATTPISKAAQDINTFEKGVTRFFNPGITEAQAQQVADLNNQGMNTFAPLMPPLLAIAQGVGGAINDAAFSKTTGEELAALPVGQTLRNISGIGTTELAAEMVSPDLAKYLQTTPTRDAPVIGALARVGEGIFGVMGVPGDVIAKPAAGIAQIGLQQAFKELTGQSTPELDEAYDKLIKALEGPHALQDTERLGRAKFDQEATRNGLTTGIQMLFDPTTYWDVFKLIPSLKGVKQAQHTIQATADVADVGKAVQNLPPIERAVLSVIKPTTLKEGEAVTDAALGLASKNKGNAARRVVSAVTTSPQAKLNNVLTRIADNVTNRLADASLPVQDAFDWMRGMREAAKNETLTNAALKEFMGAHGIVDSLDNRRLIRAAQDLDFSRVEKDYRTAKALAAQLKEAQTAGRPFVAETAAEIADSAKALGKEAGYRNIFDTAVDEWKAGKIDLNQLDQSIDQLAKHRLASDFIEHGANTLAKASGVAPTPFMNHLIGKMRAYEGLLFLSQDLAAHSSNVLGDIAQLVTHGVKPRDLGAFYKRIGYNAPEDIGSIVKQAVKKANAGQAVKAVPASGLPSALRDVPGWSEVSNVLERSQAYGRELAWANSYEKFMQNNFKYGVHFPGLPDAYVAEVVAREGPQGLRRRIAELENARNAAEAERALFGKTRTWQAYREELAVEQSKILSELAGRDVRVTPEMAQAAHAIQDQERLRAVMGDYNARVARGENPQAAFRAARKQAEDAEAAATMDAAGISGTAKPTSRGVPLMITRDMERRLRALGYDEAAIGALRPQAAQDILKKGTRAAPTPTIETGGVRNATDTAAPREPLPGREPNPITPAAEQGAPTPDDLPAQDLRRYVSRNPALHTVDPGAWDHLLHVKNADGTAAFTAEQLATWKPEALEQLAIQHGYVSSTYNDLLKLFTNKTGKNANKSGNYFRDLLNAEIKRKAFYDPELAGIKPFANWQDVQVRSWEAYRVLRDYSVYPTLAEAEIKFRLRLRMMADRLSAAEQDGLELVYDALGEAAAKRAGVDVDTWWSQHVAGIEGGPGRGAGGLRQPMMRVGVSPAKGRFPSSIDDDIKKGMDLIAQGKGKQGEAKLREALQPAIDHLRAVLGKPVRQLEFTFGRFGELEPTLYLKAEVDDETLPEFMYALSRIADENFGQHAVLFFRKTSSKTLGPMSVQGIRGTVEPYLQLNFKRALIARDLKFLDKAAAEARLPGYTLRPDRKGLEIVRVPAYNEINETAAEFKQKLRDFAVRVNRRGVVRMGGSDVRGVWLAGSPTFRGRPGALVYNKFARDIEKRFPDAAKRVQERLAANPYAPPPSPQALKQLTQGATEFLRDGRALLRFFQGKADASTYLHEAFHVFFPTLDPGDLDEFARWTGLESGAQLRDLHNRWVTQDPTMGTLTGTRADYQFRDMASAANDAERYVIAQEKGARGFEKFFSEGKAPTERLQVVFDQFKEFLVRVYHGIVGSAIDVQLSDEMRQLYGRMLGADSLVMPPALQSLDGDALRAARGKIRGVGKGSYPTGRTIDVADSLKQQADTAPLSQAETPTTIARSSRGVNDATQLLPEMKLADGLDAEQRAVESRIIQDVRTNTTEYLDAYGKKFGNFVSADTARELFPEYRNDPAHYTSAVGAPSYAVAQAYYRKLLSQPVQAGKNKVIFLVGGGGSGKTTAVKAVGLENATQEAEIVFEKIWRNPSQAQQDINEALDAGREVVVYYVHRPIEQAATGVLRRTVQNRRIYPVDRLASGHFQGQDTLLQLPALFQGKNVRFRVIDNSGRLEDARIVEVNALAKTGVKYTSAADVETRARKAIQDEYNSRAGTNDAVPDDLYNATLQTVTGRGSGPNRQDPLGEFKGERAEGTGGRSSAESGTGESRPGELNPPADDPAGETGGFTLSQAGGPFQSGADQLRRVYAAAQAMGPPAAIDRQINAAWNRANLEQVLDTLAMAIRRDGVSQTALSPQSEAEARHWLKSLYNAALNTAKLAANVTGNWGAQATALNQDHRYNIDDSLIWNAPFTYWWLHTLLDHTKSFVEQPYLRAYYAKTRQMLDEKSKEMPDPYKQHVAFPMVLAEEDGSAWMDPLRGFIPEQDPYLLSNLERAGFRNRKADGTLDYTAAYNALFGIHKPEQLAWWLATGQPDELKNLVASLPGARLVQGVTSLTRPGGGSIETRYDKAYYTRALDELVAEGSLTAEEAKVALLRQNGQAWDMVKQRAGLDRYTLRGVSGASGLPGPAFTPGEQKYLGAVRQKERLMHDAVVRLGGNPRMTATQRDAFLNRRNYFASEEWLGFKEQHPELDTDAFGQTAFLPGGANGGADPTQSERYTLYLSDQIRSAYRALPQAQQKLALRVLGSGIQKMLSGETSGISTDALDSWANRLGVDLPQAAHPDPGAPDPRRVLWQNAPQAHAYQTWYDSIDHAKVDPLLEQYFAIPETDRGARAQFRASNPDLAEYWASRKDFLAHHPDVVELLMNPTDAAQFFQEYRANVNPWAAEENETSAPDGKKAAFETTLSALGLTPDAFDAKRARYYALPSGAARRAYLEKNVDLLRAFQAGKVIFAEKDASPDTARAFAVSNSTNTSSPIEPGIGPGLRTTNQYGTPEMWRMTAHARKKWNERQQQSAPQLAVA